MNEDLQNKLNMFFQTFLAKARERDNSAEITVQQQFNPFEGHNLIVTLNAESGVDRWMISVKNGVPSFIRILG